MEIAQLLLELAQLFGRVGAGSFGHAKGKLRLFVVKLGLEDRAGSGDGVALVVEKALDAEYHFDVAAAVEALAGAAFMRLEGGKLALPEAENVGRQIAESGHLADAEVKLVRDFGPGGWGRFADRLMLR